MVYLQFNTLTVTGPTPARDYASIGRAIVATDDSHTAIARVRDYLATHGHAMGEPCCCRLLTEDELARYEDGMKRLYRSAERHGLACLLSFEEVPTAEEAGPAGTTPITALCAA